MELWLILLIAFLLSCVILFFAPKNCNNDGIIFILQIACCALGVVFFFVGLVTVNEKTSFKSTLNYLEETENNIILFHNSIKINPSYIIPCKDEVEDYNTSLNRLVSSVNFLRLKEREQLQGFYNYYLDNNTLELTKEPVSIK